MLAEPAFEFLRSLWTLLTHGRHLETEFQLPLVFDLFAVFFFSTTGALAAIRRGYDWVGLFAMALVTGAGGGLIRDGIFLQNGPPALTTDGRYVLMIIAGCFAGLVVGNNIERFQKAIAYLDALGLGAYSVVGVQKSLAAGLSIPAAIMVGVINAAGGGLLRDVIVRVEPLALKPGQFYVLTALLGCLTFIGVTLQTPLDATQAAVIAIGVTVVFRVLAIYLNWQTTAVRPWFASHGVESTKSDDTEAKT